MTLATKAAATADNIMTRLALRTVRFVIMDDISRYNSR